MYPGVWAQTTPDKPAVIMAGSGRSTTYRELDDRSAAIAAALYSRGIRKGDVIGLLTDNTPEAFEIYWAALRSGLYITAINFHLTPTEVAYIIDDSDAKVLFASAGVSELAEQVAPLVSGVGEFFAFGGQVEGYQAYDELVDYVGDRLADQPRGSEMLYSSGTTGRPKGVRWILPEIQVNEPGDPIAALLAAVFKVTADDTYLSPAPLYHAAPLKWGGAVHALGGTVVILEDFDAEGLLAAIEKYHVTIAQFVPTHFVRILSLPEEARGRYDVSSLRIAVHAAAPISPDVKTAMIDLWGPRLVEYYSSTENNGLTFISSPEWQQKRGSVGRAVQGILHIADEDGTELGTGEVGLVYFERDARPFEYHKDAEKTKAAEHPLHPNWTTVGDLGYVDEDGYLFLTDRKAFTIISGGVNVYPQEIENVLALHPQIYDVAVIGVPDTEFGQSVKAVVQLKEGAEPSDELAAEIIQYVKERIARFKAPRTVDFVESLPRTPTGKLVKRDIEKSYRETAEV